jgi:hypothetical protein
MAGSPRSTRWNEVVSDSAGGLEGGHVDVKYHFIAETVKPGKVKPQWVPTSPLLMSQ